MNNNLGNSNHNPNHNGKFDKAMSRFLSEFDMSKEDLILNLLSQEKQKEKIPAEVFSSSLAPLEAIVFYLKTSGRKINEISSILKKNHSSVSLAYKNAVLKKPQKISYLSNHQIPLSEFSSYFNLSILEIVVHFLKNQMSFSQISSLLKKDYKTIYTVYKRAEKKLKHKKRGEK